MTREDARFEAMGIDRDAGNHGGKYVDVEELVTRIYDDFEEELKKAYIEGGNDVWKALNCKELAK